MTKSGLIDALERYAEERYVDRAIALDKFLAATGLVVDDHEMVDHIADPSKMIEVVDYLPGTAAREHYSDQRSGSNSTYKMIPD